jgi:F420-dependent oxidoreductase-like protein
MIEAQNGLNWPRWQRIARAVEDLGFAGLYRSDHFTNASPPDQDSLELWVSFTWLASHTQRIEFGSLVSPVSFRDPVFTARMALQVDDLSGGRLRLGLGAGWQEHEHHNFGYQLLELDERFARFEEGLEVITRLMDSDTPVDFSGRYYHLNEAILLPRPARPGGPPVVIGGNGERRTLPLVVRYAEEWNAVDIPPTKLRALNRRLDDLLDEAGRTPVEVKRTVMTTLVYGRDETSLREKLAQRDPDTLKARGVVFGTINQVVDQVGQLRESGAARVMLRWLDLDDMDGLESLARGVLPAFG